jgi:flagellar assembly factor FliW
VPELHTAGFGVVAYEEASVLRFPAGLPAFEEEREFLLIEKPETAPILFLQSLRTPDLAFLTIPVGMVDPAYRPALEAEDAALVELPSSRDVEAGENVGCLGIITIPEGGAPTVNLMAPIIINRSRRLGVQAIQCGAGYSHEHPLVVPQGEDVC